MSESDGMFNAFLAFVADDGVILSDGAFPLEGKEAISDYYKDKSDTSFILTWKPIYQNMSGDLGYTYGIYENLQKSTGNVRKGTYVTIWKKQEDGSWKFVLDAGTQGLPGE